MKLRTIQNWMMQREAADLWSLRIRDETHEGLTLAEVARHARRHSPAPAQVKHATLPVEGEEWVEFEHDAGASRTPWGEPRYSLPPFPLDLLCPSRIPPPPPPPPPDACKDTINSVLNARVESLENRVRQLTDFIETLYRNHHELFEEVAPGKRHPEGLPPPEPASGTPGRTKGRERPTARRKSA